MSELPTHEAEFIKDGTTATINGNHIVTDAALDDTQRTLREVIRGRTRRVSQPLRRALVCCQSGDVQAVVTRNNDDCAAQAREAGPVLGRDARHRIGVGSKVPGHCKGGGRPRRNICTDAAERAEHGLRVEILAADRDLRDTGSRRASLLVIRRPCSAVTSRKADLQTVWGGRGRTRRGIR